MIPTILLLLLKVSCVDANCTATCLPSRKLYRLDEPDTPDTAGEASDVLLWTPTYGQAKAGRPARTYIQQLCEDTGYNPEDLPEAMNDREKWRERVRDIRAGSTTWWWLWGYIYKTNHAYMLWGFLNDIVFLGSSWFFNVRHSHYGYLEGIGHIPVCIPASTVNKLDLLISNNFAEFPQTSWLLQCLHY